MKRSILIVEDDEPFRERLALAFQRRGHMARTAATVAEALAAIDIECPDGAVIDLKLAEESGLAIVRHLHQSHPTTRMIILTGYGSIATAVDAIRLGASDYLSKPADAEQILFALFGEPPVQTVKKAPAVPSLDRVEWEHLQRVLHECDGNISKAARLLGMERRSLQRRLQKYPPQR